MNDKISVVVTTRNRQELLRSTLRCVLDQSWKNIEVIVVDEASSDGTLEMLAADFPEATAVHHDTPRGISGARNSGLERASGDWVFFLDDDDLIHPRHLEELLAATHAAPPNSIVTGPMRDFAVSDGQIVFAPTFCAPSNRSDADTLNELLEPTSQRTVTHSTILWPRAMFDTMKWDEELGFNEDFDMFGRAILSGRHIVGRRAGMYYVRMHSGHHRQERDPPHLAAALLVEMVGDPAAAARSRALRRGHAQRHDGVAERMVGGADGPRLRPSPAPGLQGMGRIALLRDLSAAQQVEARLAAGPARLRGARTSEALPLAFQKPAPPGRRQRDLRLRIPPHLQRSRPGRRGLHPPLPVRWPAPAIAGNARALPETTGRSPAGIGRA
jgi:hypothetical protein